MKSIFIIISVLFSLNAAASCYEKLTDGYSADSRVFSFDLDELEEESGKNMAREVVNQIYEKLNCAQVKVSEVTCYRLGSIKHETCYAETNDGFFFVNPDMVQTINVIFNRYD